MRVDRAIEGIQRICQLFDLKLIRQWKPRPVFNKQQILECLQLILLEKLNRRHNQIVCDELVQGLVRIMDAPGELA